MNRVNWHILSSFGVISLFVLYLSIFKLFFDSIPLFRQSSLLQVFSTLFSIVLSVLCFYFTLVFSLALVSKLSRLLLSEKRESLSSIETFMWNLSEECFSIVYSVSRIFFIHSPFPLILYQLFGLQLGQGVNMLGRIYGPSLVSIGDNSMVGTFATIDPQSRNHSKLVLKPIHIGKNVTIGVHCSISAGAHFQDDTVLATGSMVAEDMVLESGWMYSGVPAKKVRKLAENNYKSE